MILNASIALLYTSETIPKVFFRISRWEVTRASSLRRRCSSRCMASGDSGIGSSGPFGAGPNLKRQSRKFHCLMPNSSATFRADLPLSSQCSTTERLNSSVYGLLVCIVSFLSNQLQRVHSFGGSPLPLVSCPITVDRFAIRDEVRRAKEEGE